MLKAMVLLEVLIAQRYPLVVDINSQAALTIMIKALDVFVDLVVSTMLKWLRARDGVGTVGSLSCGVVVRVSHVHVGQHSSVSVHWVATISTVRDTIAPSVAAVASAVAS